MKKFGIKSVVAAVGALAAVCAHAAAVNLDTGTVSVKYANEVITTNAITLKGDGTGLNADLKAATTLGASFGQGAVAYVRYDLTNATFGAAVTDAHLAADSIDPAIIITKSVAQGGGAGSSYVIFALGTVDANKSLSLNDTLTLDLDPAGLATANKNGVQLRYQLFETLTAAVNQTAGTSLKNVNKTIAEFAPTITATIDTLGQRVSDVAASPSFTAFTAGTADLPFAKYKVAVGTTFNPLSPVGAPVAAASILGNTNSIVVTGNFSYVATGSGGTPPVVYLVDAGGGDCSAGPTGNPQATTTATTATFSGITAANITATNGWFLCADARVGGTKTEIQPTNYSAAVNLVPQTGFAVSGASGASGSIVTNGATLIAPLTNHPAGWYSRLVLVNSGSLPREYNLSYITETGTTVAATGDAVSGTIPANTTLVIPLQDANMVATPLLETTAGKRRASVKAVVKAPLSEITGSYQIVEPNGLSISNQTMVEKQ